MSTHRRKTPFNSGNPKRKRRFRAPTLSLESVQKIPSVGSASEWHPWKKERKKEQETERARVCPGKYIHVQIFKCVCAVRVLIHWRWESPHVKEVFTRRGYQQQETGRHLQIRSSSAKSSAITSTHPTHSEHVMTESKEIPGKRGNEKETDEWICCLWVWPRAPGTPVRNLGEAAALPTRFQVNMLYHRQK